MEPIDVAYAKFCTFVDQVVPTYWDTIHSEADARMKLIDPVFTDVLGWPGREIHLEDQAGEGRIDYRLTVNELSRLIVEAKKEGRNLGVSEDYAGRSFKLNGSVFNLRKRIEYLESRIKEQDPVKGRNYFTSRGIRLDIDNIKAFAACLQTVFINTGQVADWIGRLANQDIRRCLQLTREIVSSPHLKVDDLLEAYVAKSAMLVGQDDVKLAIIRGKYDIYPSSNNSFVQNVFAFVSDLDTTPLIAVRILQFLEVVWEGNTASDTRYAPTESLVEYLNAMGVEPRATRGCLQAMLETGLCLSYDPTAKTLEGAPKLQLSPSGRQHLAWAQRDWVYLESMAEVTPLLDLEAHTAIKAAVQSGTAHGRREAVRVFISYLLDEDAHYCVIPKHGFFSCQDNLGKTLAQQARHLVSATGVFNASRRYGRAQGRVAAWIGDRGFGFIRQNDGDQDAYVHISDVINPDGDRLNVGTAVEYDTVPGPERPKAIKVLVLSDAAD